MEKFDFAKDKFYHFIICFITSIINPLFAAGLALGKEYGDKNAEGNHWCWWDILMDVIGIICGIPIHLFILWKL